MKIRPLRNPIATYELSYGGRVQRDEVHDTLAGLAGLLSAVGERRTARQFTELATELQDSRNDQARRQVVIRLIMQWYQGGADSFQDHILQDARGVRPEQQTFDELRDRLFETAREELR
jgi:hypothetical protein